MKNFIICQLLLFSCLCLNSQETFQIEAYSLNNAGKIRFAFVENLDNGHLVFSGTLEQDSTNVAIVGLLSSTGEIIKAYRLDVSEINPDVDNFRIIELIVHPEGEFTFLTSFNSQNYFIRVDNSFNIKYSKIHNHYTTYARTLLADKEGNTYLNERLHDWPTIIKLDPDGAVLWKRRLKLD